MAAMGVVQLICVICSRPNTGVRILCLDLILNILNSTHSVEFPPGPLSNCLYGLLQSLDSIRTNTYSAWCSQVPGGFIRKVLRHNGSHDSKFSLQTTNYRVIGVEKSISNLVQVVSLSSNWQNLQEILGWPQRKPNLSFMLAISFVIHDQIICKY